MYPLLNKIKLIIYYPKFNKINLVICNNFSPSTKFKCPLAEYYSKEYVPT